MTFMSTVGCVFSVDWVIFGDSVFWGDDDGSAVGGFAVADWLSGDVLVGSAVGDFAVAGWLWDDVLVVKSVFFVFIVVEILAVELVFGGGVVVGGAT